MKKFIVVLLATLGLVLYGVSPATASPTPVVAAAPTVIAPSAVSANLAGGIGGPVLAANFTSCYWNIFGQYWCYRYGCTLYDLVKYNCYNGWIKINRPWYA